MSFITFNGKSSKDFHLRLEAGLNFSSPARDIEFQKIDGQDGEMAIGDGTLKNVPLSYPFRIDVPKGKTLEQVSTDISNWLKQDALWHDLVFGGDPAYVYRALFYEEYSLERIIPTLGKCVLTFRAKPYKFLKTSLTEVALGASIENPTKRTARPKIILRGTGNITLKIGPSTWTFKNVDQGLIVDTLYGQCTTLDGTRPQWSKLTSYPLPGIQPGKNSVLTTGNVTSIRIVPRWEAIVG